MQRLCGMLSVNSGISRLQIVENTMPTAKEAMVNIIARQPDDSSYDEILRELAFAQMVERGLADSDAGRTLTDSEVRTRIDSWQK